MLKQSFLIIQNIFYTTLFVTEWFFNASCSSHNLLPTSNADKHICPYLGVWDCQFSTLLGERVLAVNFPRTVLSFPTLMARIVGENFVHSTKVSPTLFFTRFSFAFRFHSHDHPCVLREPRSILHRHEADGKRTPSQDIPRKPHGGLPSIWIVSAQSDLRASNRPSDRVTASEQLLQGNLESDGFLETRDFVGDKWGPWYFCYSAVSHQGNSTFLIHFSYLLRKASG